MTPNPSSVLRPLAALGRSALRLVLPPRCLSCAALVGQPGGLCAICFSDLPLIAKPVCERTGKPLAYDLGGAFTSAEALADPPLYNRMRSAARYEGTAARLVNAFKYHDRLELALPLARHMVRAGKDILNETDILVPVPLHRHRLFERRFNQSAELAKSIARLSGKPLALQALVRIRATEQQARLDAAARRTNVEGAFRVAADQSAEIRGRRVTLIDDVVTTGATITACVRALLREKCQSVDVLTFAKVVEPWSNGL
ncbi:MAG: ComF family protein [Rhizobiales bacterium]|nr:ComF family protein [Hyphomicrobiales bacterium]